MTQGEHVGVVRRALREGPFSMRQLAAESGLSYDVLRSWRSGRRTPNVTSVDRLAEGLARRADTLRALALELQRATNGHGQGEGGTGGQTGGAASPRSAQTGQGPGPSAAYGSGILQR